VVLEWFAAPGPEHEGLGFLQPCLRFGMFDPVALIVIDIVGCAAAETDKQPATAQVVDQCQLLGKADRVVQRRLKHSEADLYPPRRHR
jgi:hypothetical protein